MVYLFSLAICLANLAPCPNTPNCVNSQATDEKHSIQAFPVFTTPEQSLAQLAAIIKSLPRTKILKHTDTYIQAEFTSKVFKFTDDVEFLYNPQKNVIDVRSASRVGYSDLGVNRARIEDLHTRYLEENHRTSK